MFRPQRVRVVQPAPNKLAAIMKMVGWISVLAFIASVILTIVTILETRKNGIGTLDGIIIASFVLGSVLSGSMVWLSHYLYHFDTTLPVKKQSQLLAKLQRYEYKQNTRSLQSIRKDKYKEAKASKKDELKAHKQNLKN